MDDVGRKMIMGQPGGGSIGFPMSLAVTPDYQLEEADKAVKAVAQEKELNKITNLSGSDYVQPRQFQGLNPYVTTAFPGVSARGFQAEGEALKKQGEVLSRSQSQYGSELGKVAKKESEAFEKLADQQKQNYQKYEKDTADFDKEYALAKEKYPSLTRQDVFNSFSTGKKALFGVAAILGGISQGLMRSNTNQVLEGINANMDQVANNSQKNYMREIDTIMKKKEKSQTDFSLGRQLLQDNASMMNNTFNAMKAEVEANYKSASSDAARFQLEAVAGQIQQKQDMFNQTVAMENAKLGLQAQTWAAQMAMNPRAVNVGVDQAGKPIMGVASSDKSAEVLRTELPVLENKIKIVRDFVSYIENHKGKRDSFSGQNIKGMQQLVAQALGVKPEDLPYPDPTFGRNAMDFYRNALENIAKQKQNLINANVIR